jgi:hypothetical protein
MDIKVFEVACCHRLQGVTATIFVIDPKDGGSRFFGKMGYYLWHGVINRNMSI